MESRDLIVTDHPHPRCDRYESIDCYVTKSFRLRNGGTKPSVRQTRRATRTSNHAPVALQSFLQADPYKCWVESSLTNVSHEE